MGTAYGEMTNIGPTILVRVMPSKGEGTRYFDGIALIDTGATSSAISEAVAQKLGLSPTGVLKGTGIDEQRVSGKTYAVSFYLPSRAEPFTFEVPAFTMATDAIIGMDIIGQHILNIGGWSKSVVLYCGDRS